MRTVFIGSIAYAHEALARLLTIDGVELVGVVTRRGSTFNPDFRCLAPLAEQAGAPVWYADGRPQADMAAWLGTVAPEVIYCMGWSRLLGPEILAIPPRGVIGYHPAALPKNRGRQPIVWALALGLEETGSTFFMMDEGVDSGPILSQALVPIARGDDAGALYRNLTETIVRQLGDFTPRFIAGTLEPRPQDESQATTWRKREPADVVIDWRMPADGVCNLVRALARPYRGALCRQGGQDVTVWRAELIAEAAPNAEPGKVLAADAAGIAVKCGSGAVCLVEHEFATLPAVNDYL